MKIALNVFTVYLFIFSLWSCREEDEEIKKEVEVVVPVTDIPYNKEKTDTTAEEAPDTTTTVQAPVDLGGKHTAHFLESGSNIFGHYLYLPSNYKQQDMKHPLIIFLHGVGEIGNSETDTAQLRKVLRNGIPKMIQNKTWNKEFNAIVATPQCHDKWWDAQKIHQFIEYLVKTYNVDLSRIYLSGISMGGFGTFDYISTFGDDSYIAAALPICGGGNKNKGASFGNIPVWAFHGDADTKVSVKKSLQMVEAINGANPVYKAKLTIYPKVGHLCWAMTFDGTGRGKESKTFDPFDMDVIKWMFQFKKDISTKKVSKN